jgi:cytochrome P450
MTKIVAEERTLKAPASVSEIGAAFRAFEQEGMDALYARARAEEPVFWAPEIGYWVITRYDDIRAILRDPERFSASNALTPVKPLPDEAVALLRDGGFTVQPVQVNSDPPVHGRIREVAKQFLNAKRFMSYQDQIRALVEAYVARLEGLEEADLVKVMTYELPARVIFLLMGIPDVDTADIKRWADNRLMVTWGRLSDAEQIDAAREMLDYWTYCKALVDARIDRPGDDYPSALLRLRNGDDSLLTVNEIYCLVFGILLAGHETTTNASTNIVRALLQRPEIWRRLGAEPALVLNAVEEGLRFATSVVAWRRRATADVEIAGVTLPAGSDLLLALTSANRDAALFADADTLDPERRNARQHLSFGIGIHTCIGAPLARLQLKIILETLTGRFPDMTLVDGQEERWVRTISFRGPEVLRVRPYG